MATKPRSFRADGIVLRRWEFGEADRVLTLFTRQRGKVKAIAKGIRKPGSRKAGHLEPFMQSTVLLAEGRSFYILTQAETVEPYIALRNDLVLLSLASYVVELLDRFTYEEEENRSLYRLLVSSLDRLNRGDDSDLVVHYYEIRLLDYTGYRPHLFTCAKCESEILPQDQFFFSCRGRCALPTMWRRSSEARPISMPALKYLRHFQRSSYQEAMRARLDAEVYAQIENLMYYYLTYVLERSLNSPGFLRRVRKLKVR